jgi:hypothetical protein
MSQAGGNSSGGGGGSGNVTGPASSTDRAIATWNGATGTALFDNPTTDIDSSGRFTNSGQPAFYAFLSANQANVTGNNTPYQIPFDSVTVDQGSNFNTGTGTYTFPVTGVYQLNVTVFIFGGTAASTLFFGWASINGAAFPGYRIFDADAASLGITANGEFISSASFIYKATAGDTMSIFVDVIGGAGNDVGVGGTFSNFSGFLIC